MNLRRHNGVFFYDFTAAVPGCRIRAISIKECIGNATTLLLKLRDADLKVEIQAALLAAQGEALDLQQRFGQLQEENAKLKKRFEARDESERLEREVLYMAMCVWWRRDQELVQPYCPSCWAKDQSLIPLTKQYRPPLQYGGICPTCKAQFGHVFKGDKPEPSTS